MLLQEIIEYNRGKALEEIQENKSSLMDNDYLDLLQFNNSIANDLLYFIALSEKGLQDPETLSGEWTLRQFIECLDYPNLDKMMVMIMGNFGAKNPKIRNYANKIAQSSCIVRQKSLSDCVSIHKTFSEIESGKASIIIQENPIFSDILETSYEIINKIVSFVSSLDVIPERREYFQPPLYTFEHVKGGDCDDLTALTCSMFESIGFESTINTIEEHVFPGVKQIIIDKNRLPRVCNLTIDPIAFKMGFNMLDFTLSLFKNQKTKKDVDSLGPNFRKLFYGVESYAVPPEELTGYINPENVFGGV